MFVVLLSCMVIAFLSGVWVGNNGAVGAESRVAEAEEAAEQSPTVQLGELNFFSEQQESTPAEPPLAQVAEAARPDTTLREELSRRVQIQSSPAMPTAGASTQAAKDSTPTGLEDTAAEPASAAEGPSVIQVFSSRDRHQADRLVDRLTDGGFPAFVISEEVEGNTVYRVRIGPYPERRRAEEVAGLVKKTFKLDTWITR